MSGMFGVEAGVSVRHKSVEWYTPAWIFNELNLSFDLDPASPFDMETFVPAVQKYTIFDNGLTKKWFGRVWLNPPYGKTTPMWIERMIEHNNGIALVFSRTDASWCQRAMQSCSALLFVSGRIEFVPGRENLHKKSRCGAGNVFLAFGGECAEALKKLSHRGMYVSKDRHLTNDVEQKECAIVASNACCLLRA